MLRKLLDKFRRRNYLSKTIKELKESDLKEEVRKNIKEDDIKNEALILNKSIEYAQINALIEEINSNENRYTESEIIKIYHQITG